MITASQALVETHAIWNERRQALEHYPCIKLSPQQTWPAFWDQVNRALRQCGYNRATRSQYRGVLRRLHRWGIARPAQLTPQKLVEFIHSLANDNYSWSWLALHISATRTIFDRLCRQSVTAKLVTPKRPTALPEILGYAEAERLVATARSIRDQLLLGLIYGCGITAAEASALTWGDVRQNGRALHIAAGTRYMERQLAVPEVFRPVLTAGAQGAAPDAPVFPGRNTGQPLQVRRIEYIVRNAARRANIDRPVNASTLRHTYAVQRLEAGASLPQLQMELGHRSIRTTQRYQRCIAPTIESHPFTKVRELMAQENPEIPKPEPPPPPRPRPSNPLANLKPIDLSTLKLPFQPDNGPKISLVQWLLQTNLVRSLFHRRQ